jgi:FlaA1/EpsC-like NDP-sugar epimerase
VNKDFLNNTVDNFLRSAYCRKLVLFGAGNQMRRAYELFLDPNDLSPDYIVDNDFRLWNSSIFGCRVCEPSVLRDENPDEIVILITSLYPFRIKPQVERMGIYNYFASSLFVEPMIGARQFMVTF